MAEESISKKVTEVTKAVNTSASMIGDTTKLFSEMQKGLNGLQDEAKNTSSQISAINKEFSSTAKYIGDINTQMQGLNASLANVSLGTDIVKKLESSLGKSVDAFSSQLSAVVSEAAKALPEPTGGGVARGSGVAPDLSSLESGVGNLTRMIEDHAASFSETGNSLSQQIESLRKIFSDFESPTTTTAKRPAKTRGPAAPQEIDLAGPIDLGESGGLGRDFRSSSDRQARRIVKQLDSTEQALGENLINLRSAIERQDLGPLVENSARSLIREVSESSGSINAVEAALNLFRDEIKEIPGAEESLGEYLKDMQTSLDSLKAKTPGEGVEQEQLKGLRDVASAIRSGAGNRETVEGMQDLLNSMNNVSDAVLTTEQGRLRKIEATEEIFGEISGKLESLGDMGGYFKKLRDSTDTMRADLLSAFGTYFENISAAFGGEDLEKASDVLKYAGRNMQESLIEGATKISDVLSALESAQERSERNGTSVAVEQQKVLNSLGKFIKNAPEEVRVALRASIGALESIPENTKSALLKVVSNVESGLQKASIRLEDTGDGPTRADITKDVFEEALGNVFESIESGADLDLSSLKESVDLLKEQGKIDEATHATMRRMSAKLANGLTRLREDVVETGGENRKAIEESLAGELTEAFLQAGASEAEAKRQAQQYVSMAIAGEVGGLLRRTSDNEEKNFDKLADNFSTTQEKIFGEVDKISTPADALSTLDEIETALREDESGKDQSEKLQALLNQLTAQTQSLVQLDTGEDIDALKDSIVVGEAARFEQLDQLRETIEATSDPKGIIEAISRSAEVGEALPEPPPIPEIVEERAGVEAGEEVRRQRAEARKAEAPALEERAAPAGEREETQIPQMVATRGEVEGRAERGPQRAEAERATLDLDPVVTAISDREGMEGAAETALQANVAALQANAERLGEMTNEQLRSAEEAAGDPVTGIGEQEELLDMISANTTQALDRSDEMLEELGGIREGIAEMNQRGIKLQESPHKSRTPRENS